MSTTSSLPKPPIFLTFTTELPIEKRPLQALPRVEYIHSKTVIDAAPYNAIPAYSVCRACYEIKTASELGTKINRGVRVLYEHCEDCRSEKDGDANVVAQANYRARKANVPGSITVDEWKQIKRQHGNCCFYCRSDKKPMQLDHYYPLSSYKMGQELALNNKKNVVPACAPCNSAKGAMQPDNFYKWLEDVKRAPEPLVLQTAS